MGPTCSVERLFAGEDGVIVGADVVQLLLVTEGCLGEHVAEDAARDASEEQSRVLAVLLGLEGQSGEALLCGEPSTAEPRQ
jgi:hypothetical protein